MVYNILKLCNTKKLMISVSLHIRSLIFGYERHFNSPEMLTNDWKLAWVVLIITKLR